MNISVVKLTIAIDNWHKIMVHKIANPMLFFGKCGWLFFFSGKTLNWVVRGVFHGD